MKDTDKHSLSSQALALALSHYKSGQPLVAEEMYRKVLSDDPKNTVSLSMLGIIAVQSGRYAAAAELLGRAIQVKKDDPLLFFTLGLALEKWGKLDEALLKYKQAVALKPDYIEAHSNIGNILKEQGRLDEAELRYKRVIAFKPDHAPAYHALGWVLNEQGKVDEAVLMYEKAIALKPDLVEAYSNLGAVFYGQKKFDEAAEMYRRAISLKPDYALVYFNLGTILKEQGKFDAAAEMYKRAISLKPDDALTRYNFGILLHEQGKPDEAIEQYAEAIALKPDFYDPHINLGRILQERGMLNEAIALYEQAQILQPDNTKRLIELVDFILNACAWQKMGDNETRMLAQLRRKCEEKFPFITIATSATAEDQMIFARLFSRSREQPQQALFTHHPAKPGGRIKIGYLSSDFWGHATAYLMAELFERHDRSRFSITGYSYGSVKKDPMRERLIKAFDDFVDLDALSDRDAAQKIYDDGVDILVDLKGGFMEGSRIGIPAYRPAPVQVNYIGYPGTMGASFIDYIIADRFIIPEDQERFYSEKVVYLPDCYQPNDTQRKIAETVPTRKACGLPEQGFIFCCFNNTYKITPSVFDIWMRLLQKVPGSVLWLLEANSSVKKNLRQEAERRGVDPERMIFAPRMSLPEHLARQRLADLFLDTLPVNAHTTTSDALWAGLPVLTCAGTTFAGRVAGSLLKAADLSELITYSLEEYEALALQLARNPARLSEIHKKLERTRLQVPLFDIEKFTKNIEKSYQTMWDIRQAGGDPEAFTVK